jgi:hypothetical protein
MVPQTLPLRSTSAAYTLETPGYTYFVMRVVGGQTHVRCVHRESGITATAKGHAQIWARQHARELVEQKRGMLMDAPVFCERRRRAIR